MTDISLSRLHQPLDKTKRAKIAKLLADSFAEDSAMIQMLGQNRWEQIAFRYFHLQLGHPDCVITAENGDRLIGVLLASSPGNSPPFLASVREMLGMKWLLGRVFKDSQRIAQAISTALPYEPVWYINQLAVDPALQNQRLGSRLLTRLEELTGSLPVYVDCESTLEGFYGRAGFQLCSRPEEIDLIVMARNV